MMKPFEDFQETLKEGQAVITYSCKCGSHTKGLLKDAGNIPDIFPCFNCRGEARNSSFEDIAPDAEYTFMLFSLEKNFNK